LDRIPGQRSIAGKLPDKRPDNRIVSISGIHLDIENGRISGPTLIVIKHIKTYLSQNEKLKLQFAMACKKMPFLKVIHGYTQYLKG